MFLADAGASVLRIDRPVPGQSHNPSHTHSSSGASSPSPSSSPTSASPTSDQLARRKRSIAVDLKSAPGIQLIKQLARAADVLIEPFRPGVLERLGLGPDVLCAANPRLVYARMAGFRRDGRYAHMAGHDINYLAVSGVLALLGRSGQRPHAPSNLVGDFGGGGAMLVLGVLLALVARAGAGTGTGTGVGQVVEANMVDGASYLATFPRLKMKTPVGNRPRGENVLDGGCPFYDTYETRDGMYMAVGALEPQFFRVLVRGLGLEGRKGWEDDEARRFDRDGWPEMRRLFEVAFRTKTRGEWEAVFDGTDACCTPVLGYAELEREADGGGGGGGGGGGVDSSGGRSGREGDQRPAVTLRGTPFLAISDATDGEGKTTTTTTTIDPTVRGQGPGVPGAGYVGTDLAPGQGGEEALSDWFGLERGTHFGVEDGGLVLLAKAKL